VAVVAAWIIDSRAHRQSVLPNVVLGGERIRGMDTAELDAVVARIADRFSTATVEVRTPGGPFRATVPELGTSVDRAATVQSVLRVGRRGPLPRRLSTWARSFLSPVKVPVVIDVDRRKLDPLLAARDPVRVPPVEPSLVVKDGHLEGAEGRDGRGLDPGRLADALSRVTPTGGTLVVSMQVTNVPPRFTKADADRLAAEAEQLASGGLQVTAGDQTAAVGSELLYRWLTAVPGEEALTLGIRDDADVLDGLAGLLPDAGVEPVNAGFTLSGGRVSITPSRTGTACCAPEARDELVAAILDP
jgi:hypothetical protein